MRETGSIDNSEDLGDYHIFLHFDIESMCALFIDYIKQNRFPWTFEACSISVNP